MPLFVRLSAECHFLRAPLCWPSLEGTMHRAFVPMAPPGPAQLPRHVLRVFLTSLLIESEEEERNAPQVRELSFAEVKQLPQLSQAPGAPRGLCVPELPHLQNRAHVSTSLRVGREDYMS